MQEEHQAWKRGRPKGRKASRPTVKKQLEETMIIEETWDGTFHSDTMKPLYPYEEIALKMGLSWNEWTKNEKKVFKRRIQGLMRRRHENRIAHLLGKSSLIQPIATENRRSIPTWTHPHIHRALDVLMRCSNRKVCVQHIAQCVKDTLTRLGLRSTIDLRTKKANQSMSAQVITQLDKSAAFKQDQIKKNGLDQNKIGRNGQMMSPTTKGQSSPREEPDVLQDCEEDQVVVLTRRVLGRVVRMCNLTFRNSKSNTAIRLEKLYGAMFPSLVMAHSLRILFDMPAHAGRILNSDEAMFYLQPQSRGSYFKK